MKNKFCPDCAAECLDADYNCPDCGFPLVIDVVSEGTRIVIRGENTSRWARISQLLRKNGLTIDTLSEANPAQNGENGSSEIETAFLQDALKASDQQKVLEEDQDAFADDFFGAPTAAIEEIRSYSQQSRFIVEVGEHSGIGILVSEFGHILVPSSVVEDAFQRKTTTVLSKGTLVEDYRTVIPKAGPVGFGRVFADLIRQSATLDLALLQTESTGTLEFDLDFDSEPKVGDAVWLAVFRGDKPNPESITISERISDASGVTYLVLNSSMSTVYEGAAVFNGSGALVGIFVQHDGQGLLLTNRQIREKAPLIYKAISGL